METVVGEEMFMNKKIIRKTKGSSLLEVLVAGVIIAICAVMLVTGFITAYNLIAESKYIKDKSDIASSVIEGATVTDPEILVVENPVGKITYEINNIPYEITGEFTSANDTTEVVKFVAFKADSRVE